MPLNTRVTDLDATRLASQLMIYGSMGGDITYDEFKSLTSSGHDETDLAGAVQRAAAEGLMISGPLTDYFLTGKSPPAQASEAAPETEEIPEGYFDTEFGIRPGLPDFPDVPDMRDTPPQDAFDAMSSAAEAELRGEGNELPGEGEVAAAEPGESEFDLAAYTKDLIEKLTSTLGNQTITIQNEMDEQLAEQNKIMKKQLEQQQQMMIAQRVGQSNMNRASQQAQLQFGGTRGSQTGTSSFKRSGSFRPFRPSTSSSLAIGGSTTPNTNKTINI